MRFFTFSFIIIIILLFSFFFVFHKPTTGSPGGIGVLPPYPQHRDSTPTMKSGLHWRVWKKICCGGVDVQVVVSRVDPLSAYSDLPWKSHDLMLLELQPASPMCI